MSATAIQRPRIAAVTNVPDPEFLAAVDRQAGQTRRREFTPLGRLVRLQIEASGIAIAHPALRRFRSAGLDWMKTGPLLGLSADEREILVASPLYPPPEIPEPAWLPAALYEPDGSVTPQAPPMIAQPLEAFAAGQLHSAGDDVWTVFQPIHQIGVSTSRGWLLIDCSADASGRHCCLVYNQAAARGHFLYGRFQLNRHQ